MATYLYKPLDPSTETHLLTTELGEWGEDIVCRLTHISISEPPEYRALSYVWGNSVIGPPNNIDHELDGEFFVLNYLMEHPRDPISNVEKVRVRDAIDHSIIKTRTMVPEVRDFRERSLLTALRLQLEASFSAPFDACAITSGCTMTRARIT
ncbi:hypothetical protein H2201_004489 [Coniosporium apollinis]|uniref:Heterokaryon incompatibility domain-containing protein n=1 Tax=Coniosporium apollinis TaxID=61459 RepID=A0ABQ9NUU5_9PEZI|nr:hypothetical protein H2201_004489 [Coniosporium apollinis]